MSGQFADQYHYNGRNYSIIKREPRKCFDPNEYGLSPDGNPLRGGTPQQAPAGQP